VQLETLEVNGVELLQETVVSQELLEVGTQGPPGPRGPIGPSGGNAVTAVAAVALGGHRIVLLNADGEADYARADEITHASIVLGMTSHAAVEGADVDVLRIGELEEVSWSWTLNQPVYLGLDGLPVQSLPYNATFSLVIGFPITPTRLFISIREPIILS
jgi:hypothetical protein